ncbi:hypothetical protein FKM82_001581 [Ascaphus truei]
MAAQCRSPRCTAERKGFRRELDSWRHRLIHCVGFESILEGLYGAGLRRDLSLFDDCEPEELVDWCLDDQCSLCSLRKDTDDDCTPSIGSAQSTPTEELISQGQFNTEKIECEAENYLNALFQKKDLPQNCDANIPLVAQELMKKMIRRFAVEYVSKSRKICQDDCDGSMVEPILTCNGIQLNQTQCSLQEEQDGPLDLTVTRIQENNFQQGDGVLDLSTKANRNGLEEISKLKSSKLGVISVLPQLDKITKPYKGNTALSGILDSLCLYHRQQLITMLKFLTEEQGDYKENCLCDTVINSNRPNKKSISPAKHWCSAGCRLGCCHLKKRAQYSHLPCVSVCLKDLRLTYPSLSFGTVKLSENICGKSHLKPSAQSLRSKYTCSKGKNCSSSLSADFCVVAPYINGRRCRSPSPPPLLPVQDDVTHLQDIILECPFLKSKSNQPQSLVSVTDSDKCCEKKLDLSSEFMSTEQENDSKLLETESSVKLQDMVGRINKKLKKIEATKINKNPGKLSTVEKRQIDTITFGNLIKSLIKTTKQKDYSFMELLNQHEEQMIQTRFRKLQGKLLSMLHSPNSSLSRHQSLQIKRKLSCLTDTFRKKRSASVKNSKKSTKNVDAKKISKIDQTSEVLSLEDSENTEALTTIQKDLTELPHNLRMHSKNGKNYFCLPNHLSLSATQKRNANEKENVESHIVPDTFKDDCILAKGYCQNCVGKSKQDKVSHRWCSVHNCGNLCCKCTSKQVSEMLNDIKVKGLKDIYCNDVARSTHLQVVIERLEDSINLASKALNKRDGCKLKTGKLYKPEIKQNITELFCGKAETSCAGQNLLLKPFNNLRKNCNLSSVLTNKDFIDSSSKVVGTKCKVVPVATNELSKTPPYTTFSSPIKLMFISKVDCTDGVKYTLSSVYVSSNKNSDVQSLKKSVGCTDNKTQEGRTTTDYCSQSETANCSRDTLLSIYDAEKTHCHSFVTHLQSSNGQEPTDETSCIDEYVVKRKRRRPPKICPETLKQIRRPNGGQLKVNVTENTGNAAEPKSGRVFPFRKKHDIDHSTITVTVNFGRSGRVERHIFEKDMPHAGASCLPLSSKNDILKCKYDEVRPIKSMYAVPRSSGCIITPKPSKILQKPGRPTKVKISGISVTIDCVSAQGRKVNILNSLSHLNQEKMSPNKDSDQECFATDNIKLCEQNNFELAPLKRSMFSFSRNDKCSGHSVRLKRPLLHVLQSIASSTSFSFRSALLHKSKKLWFNKFKDQKRKLNNWKKLWQQSSRNTACLKKIDFDDQRLGLISNIYSNPVFQSNAALKWWSASTSNDSLLEDLDNRYQQITNTWLEVNNMEKVGKTQSSSTLKSCDLRSKKSPVQILFQKKCPINDLSTWFMQTTETQSLSIVRKVDAFNQLEVSSRKGSRARTKQFSHNSNSPKKHTQKCVELTAFNTSKELQSLCKIVHPEGFNTRNVTTSEELKTNQLNPKNEEWNMNNLQSTDEQSKDQVLNLGCHRETMEEINADLVKVQEKCTLVAHKEVLSTANDMKCDSHHAGVQLPNALVCVQSTAIAPCVKLGTLLKNAVETPRKDIYGGTNKQKFKDCRVFLKKLSDSDTKKSHENKIYSLELVKNNTPTEVNKYCTLRSDLGLIKDFNSDIKDFRTSQPLNKSLRVQRKAKDPLTKKTGNEMCSTKSGKYVRTDHSTSNASIYKINKKRKRCGAASEYRETRATKRPKQQLVNGESEYSNLEFGYLKPVELKFLRGPLSEVGTYSLTPIRIPLHGSTKVLHICSNLMNLLA